jgi:hypothetical protein
MVTLKLENTAEVFKGIKDLYNMGDVRKRDITKAFRVGSRLLVKQAKSLVPVRKTGEIKSRYLSRRHSPGTLRRAIRFRISKKYRLAYFVGATSSNKQAYNAADPFYQKFFMQGTKGAVVGATANKDKKGGKYTKEGKTGAFMYGRWVGKGTVISGQQSHPFMDQAISATESQVMNAIEKELGNLIGRVWA